LRSSWAVWCARLFRPPAIIGHCFCEDERMRAICLISGGIDSPVAAHLMLSAGWELAFMHADRQACSDRRTAEKVRALVQRLAQLHKRPLRLWWVPHGPVQAAILNACERRLTCPLCRVHMYRAAEAIAKAEGAAALVTGENLGQVASQTLANLAAEDGLIGLPVLRPLLCYDKEETVAIAKAIGTYELSIAPAKDCSIVPRHPVTRCSSAQLLEQIGALPGDVVERAVAQAKAETIA